MKIDIQKLLSGDRRTLAKAITLIESSRLDDNAEAQDLLKAILPHTGKSMRLGVTGVPGVGKSTFIESFGLNLISKGHKLAVLAIDPSSPVSGGSILGDKTRMEKLSQENNAFIRPSPSSGFLGGVAQKTRESILLCEAAGFDYIIIETVGVGQSEYEVAAMVDFFIVLMLPNAGDELQGIKKGILELADALIINKADGDAINQAIQSLAQYQSVIDLVRNNPNWKTRVMSCSALKNQNIDLIYQMIVEFTSIYSKNDLLNNKRLAQNKNWFHKIIDELFGIHVRSNEAIFKKKAILEQEVISGKKLALVAAQEYVNLVFKKAPV
jgi:LAO/AO transport system kinase